MADSNSIGSVSVEIVGDQSKLKATINDAVGTAQAGGDKIAQAMNAAAIKTATLQLAVDTLKQKYDGLQQSGVRTASQQQQMENLAQRLAIANDRLALSLDHVAVSTEHVAAASEHAAVSGQQATSAFIRVGEGAGALRAVETFLAKTLGLGPAMQAIFPVVGAIAFIEILGHVGEKIYEVFTQGANAQEKMRGEAAQLHQSLLLTNDALQVSNDKLDNEIAKLTGGHPNALKLMLDEAKESADKLAEALGKDGKALYDFLKQNQPGFFARLLGTAGTGDITESQGGKTGFGGANEQTRKIGREGRDKLDQLSARTDIDDTEKVKQKNLVIADTNKRIGKVYDDQLAGLKVQLSAAQTEAAQRKQGIVNTSSSPEMQAAERYRVASKRDVDTRVESLQATIDARQQEKEHSQLATEAEPKKDRVAGLQADKAEFDKWLHQQEQKIALQKSNGLEIDVLRDKDQQSGKAAAKTIEQQEIDAYDKLIAIVKTKGAAYLDTLVSLQIKTNELAEKYAGKRSAESAKQVEEQASAFEARLKQVHEEAVAAGSETPHTAALQTAQARVAQGPGVEIGSYQKAIDQIPQLTEEAVKESEAIIKKMAKDSGEAFAESGQKTSAQTSEYYSRLISNLEALGGAEDEITEARKKKREADKANAAESLKIADVDVTGRQKDLESGAAAAKTIVEAQYEAQITHTVQETINEKKQLAGFELAILEGKRAAAAAEFENAVAAGDTNKEIKASEAYLEADNAIRNKRLTIEAELNKTAREGTAEWQIQAGLMKDVASAADGLSANFAKAVVQGKGIGTVWRDSLKSLETSALETVMKSVTTSLLNAGKGILTSITGAIGGTVGGILGKIGLGGVDPKTIAENALTGSVQLLTASNQALLAALTGNTGATATNTGATVTNSVSTNVNTGAVIANTIALVFKTVKDAVMGAAKKVGGLFSGGDKEATGIATSIFKVGVGDQSNASHSIGGGLGQEAAGLIGALGSTSQVINNNTTATATDAQSTEQHGTVLGSGNVATATNTTATLANTVALTTKAISGLISGGASAAAGVGGAAASAAGTVASAASTALAGIGPLISGAVGGLISGIFTLIGDKQLAKHIDGTTAAVDRLGGKLGPQVPQKEAVDSSIKFGSEAPSPSKGAGGIGALFQMLGAATGLGSLFKGIGPLLGIGNSKPAPAAKESVTTGITFGGEAEAGIGVASSVIGPLTSALTGNTDQTKQNTGATGGLTTSLASMVSGAGGGIGSLLSGLGSFLPLLGFAAGGDPDPNEPFVAGEHGPEIIHPKGHKFTVISGDKTARLLASGKSVSDQITGAFSPAGLSPDQASSPALPNLSAPPVPASATASGYESAPGSTDRNSAGYGVTNHNTGRVGDTHFNIYGANNPRETMRQIADFEKRQTGKFSPANS